MSVQTLTFGIDGMTCIGCVNSVNKAVTAVNGVVNCKASLDNANVTITFDDELTSADVLKEVVEDAGYDII
ncbi:heavy-metal-associated domain-containing protein [Moraxella boevrei]|uniref:heavy-metal-associated domain-containing protein n=1 Tax=Faucicola boevrei TaxID=346665 RepID=UPI003736E946